MVPRMRPGTRVVALALVGAAALLALLIVVELSGIVELGRAAAGLAGLLLPGMALGIARRPATALPRLDLFLAAAALSLAAIAIAGLIFNVLPIGLGRTSWLGLIAGLLIATAVLARGGLPRLQRERLVLPKPGQAFAMVAAVILVALALVIARAGVKQPSEPFSALWAVPAPAGMVQIGLDNREEATATYRIEVTLDGVVDATFPSITLANGERWTTLVASPEAEGPRLEVLVFLGSRPGVVYRRVTLSAGGEPEGTGTAPS
jgi:hypothetical protein